MESKEVEIVPDEDGYFTVTIEFSDCINVIITGHVDLDGIIDTISFDETSCEDGTLSFKGQVNEKLKIVSKYETDAEACAIASDGKFYCWEISQIEEADISSDDIPMKSRKASDGVKDVVVSKDNVYFTDDKRGIHVVVGVSSEYGATGYVIYPGSSGGNAYAYRIVHNNKDQFYMKHPDYPLMTRSKAWPDKVILNTKAYNCWIRTLEDEAEDHIQCWKK